MNWERSYGDLELEHLVEAPSHDGYLLVGQRRQTATSALLPVLLRVESDGQLRWARYFDALDYEGQPANLAHTYRVIVDSINSKYVVVGDSCEYGRDQIPHCRPWMAQVDDNGALAWLNEYLGGGEFGVPDSTLLSVAQASGGDLVAVGYAAQPVATGIERWPIAIVAAHSTGATRDFFSYDYITTPADETVFEDVTNDPHQAGYIRVAGTVYGYYPPDCPPNPPFPKDCTWPTAPSSQDVAFTALLAVPSIATGLGAPSDWRTFEDATWHNGVPTRTYGHRVTVAPNGNNNIFIGADAGYFCGDPNQGPHVGVDHAVLIRVTEDGTTYSGVRYPGLCEYPLNGAINGLQWYGAGSGSGATAGLLMSVDYRYVNLGLYGPNPYRGIEGLIRSDLNGDCEDCFENVEVISHELDPRATQVPYDVTDWLIHTWTPDDPEETPERLACYAI